jgi:hypothetical protein
MSPAAEPANWRRVNIRKLPPAPFQIRWNQKSLHSPGVGRAFCGERAPASPESALGSGNRERKTRWLGAERCLAAQLSHGAGKAVLMQPRLA